MTDPLREPRFFATAEEFRDWLDANGADAAELLVGFHKKGTGRQSITWPEAVDQALCFGWIDGVRRRIDDERYTIRFTPRRARSNWSAVNLARAQELADLGLMRPAGLAAYERRVDATATAYSYERRAEAALTEEFQRQFQANPDAWSYFQARPASYRQAAVWWVMSAKKEETRRKRLQTLIADSAQGRTVPPFTRPAGNE
jgi:uncharacterized protein YdeI (YjbR/CyaY-like superfamily)